jgi:hypothetical protein
MSPQEKEDQDEKIIEYIIDIPEDTKKQSLIDLKNFLS